MNFIPYGEGYTHLSYALSTSPVTLSTPINANGILVQALTQNARFTMDGSAPSSTKGFQLKAGDPPLMIPIETGITLKWVAETAGVILEYDWSRAR